jgi:Tfp pilus assembly protein PilO
MHFTCRSFIGHPSDTSWSQFWEMEPDDPSLVSRRGHLFGLINFSTSSPDGVAQQGRHLIDEINEFYYAPSADGPVSQLTNTLTRFSQSPDNQSDHLTLILAVVLGDRLHLAVYNLGHCLLKRDNHISPLLTGQSGSVGTISGRILDADRLLLCTDGFYQDITLEVIKTSLSQETLDSVEENFLSRLYSLEHQSLLAGALIEIHEDVAEHIDSSLPSPPDVPTPPPPAPSRRPFPSFFPRVRPSYIAHVDSPTITRRKKINILLALVILVALSVSIYYGYHQNRAKEFENQYQSLKSELETRITNAQTVKSLSLSDALKEAKEAQTILQKMSPYKTVHVDEMKKLADAVSALLSQTGSADSFIPESFFDTGLINNNQPYSQISFTGDSLYLLDAANGHVDKLDVSNKSYQNIITSDNIKNTQIIGENNGIIYLLKDASVLAVQGQLITPKINLLDQIKDFSGGQLRFWNSSLYVLSTGGSLPSIWKYNPNAGGFSPGVNWLKQPSLSANSTSLAINGDIWVVTKNGVITPYSLGVKKDFKQSGSPALTDAANLVSSPASDILAFTDQGSQVYTYNKSGKSLSQYNFGSLKILSLAYYPATNSIFVLCQDRHLYKISL